jgi:hypothetical protein
MAEPEPSAAGERTGGWAPTPPRNPGYGRYVGLLGLVIVVLITLNTILTRPNGSEGLAPGAHIPPFAVPLALASLEGDADIATRLNEGAAGRVPACRLRRAGVLNVCALYERAPLVLALFVEGGSCPQILGQMQALVPAFPGVGFAAVAIKGEHHQLRKLVRARRITFPVGVDRDGALAALYKVASCPQVTFVLPGGVVAGRPLLGGAAAGGLRARVAALVRAASAGGWRGPAA